MAFVVTGTATSEAVTFTFETPSAALRKAQELEASRAPDVALTDGNGLQYAPNAFERVFLADEPTI